MVHVPLRRSPLVDQAADLLRARITAGEWPVGTRLPGETTLARDLGVGRSTVREAVRALAGAGLLESRQGSGVYVLALEPVTSWDVKLRQASVADVFEVRTLLEVEAARLAATRRDDADLAVLESALAARKAAASADDPAFVDADIALHTAVVAAAHNPVLTGLFHTFVPRLRAGLLDLLRMVPLREETPDHGHTGHAALVKAIRARDDDLAAHVMHEEVQRTLALVRSARTRPGDGA
ncbi:FadR family transcriptional regulator [Actinomadura logoneensis]|uniref:FadR family transcriptional regulator n=1 Tax=Actinomadura logoneensis TaxID=2293572 RepID=A0A372J937_9ACTN|nr:FadR/GntR family transcriptional regulator [Actinomadura logoneensis]RFU36503.1 FadR family transcriptional regulator [Actinomadura logoneensis]